MFGRFRLRRALSKIITSLKLSPDALYVFQRGVDGILPDVKTRKLDPVQGCVLLISNTLVQGATNGALKATKEQLPALYDEMKILWVFCGECVRTDYDRFAPVLVVGKLKGSPFDEVE